MANENISMPLVMVAAPAQQLNAVRTSRSRSRLSSYHFTLIVQKIGVILLVSLLSLAAYSFISNYLVRSVKVVGTSMVPTLGEGNHYLLDVWALRHRDPQRNDIVVIRDPGDHGLAVKRIVAMPGESILFKEGSVYVDGKKLKEPYLLPHTRTFTYSQAKEQFITCGKDQYFVLGDNRIVSVDSRSYGPVPRENVLGLVKLN